MCPYPRSPSHRTSLRSHSPCRTSTGWGCSARSRIGTGSTGSSSGPLLGFLTMRGESCEPQRYLTSLEHSRGVGSISGRATAGPESITLSICLSSTARLQNPHSSQPSLACCHHYYVCVLGASWPDPTYDLRTRADSKIKTEHGTNGEANPATLK